MPEVETVVEKVKLDDPQAQISTEEYNAARDKGLDFIERPVEKKADEEPPEIKPEEEEAPEQRIERLMAAREKTRKNKNWAEADRIRDELAKMGIRLQDNEDGTTTAHVYLTARSQGAAMATATPMVKK